MNRQISYAAGACVLRPNHDQPASRAAAVSISNDAGSNDSPASTHRSGTTVAYVGGGFHPVGAQLPTS